MLALIVDVIIYCYMFIGGRVFLGMYVYFGRYGSYISVVLVTFLENFFFF